MENENSANNDIQDILAIGRQYGLMEKAVKWIEDGKSLKDFQAFLTTHIGAQYKTQTIDTSTPVIGLTPRELNLFSFLKITNAVTNPTDQRAQEAAAFELECSAAARKISGRSHRGIVTIPDEVLTHSNRPDYARDMQVLIDPQGGYLVGTDIRYSSFIEMLDNAMLVTALGAIIVRDLQGDVAFPKKTDRSTAYWVGEKDDLTESEPALAQVALRPKTVGAYTDLSRRLIVQTGQYAEALVKNDLAVSLALAIDLAALNGAGTPHRPMGILQTDGIGSVSLSVASTPSFVEVVDMKKEVAIDNALIGSLGYLTNATIASNMEQTAKETGYPVYILENGKVAGKKCEVSNQVPSGKIVFGDWSSLMLGYWSGLDLNVDTSTLSKSGGVRIVVLQDVDVALKHAESFCVAQ